MKLRFDLQLFAITDRDDSNYLGELFLIGANQTPFLNMIGGLTGGGKTTTSFEFPLAQPYALSSASQDTQSEATAAAAGTATTVTRAQDLNTCQIMKYDVGATFAKQSTTGEIAGLSAIGDQPVMDELTFQKNAGLRQMAINIEYSFLRGAYTQPSTTSTNQKTRGICTACTTNTVAAGSVDLSKSLIDQLLRTMAANGAEFNNMVAFCNGFQKQMISDIYAFAPQDRNVGGVNIKTVETDFCSMGVVYAPQMSTSVLLIADMTYCAPMFCLYEGSAVGYYPISRTAAAESGFFYTQIGIDYGPEEFHGTITGLTTS